MATIPVYNGTDGPVVLDAEGHTLGGGEWRPVEQTDEVTAALEAGRLAKVDTRSAGADAELDPEAAAALELEDKPARGRKATTEEN